MKQTIFVTLNTLISFAIGYIIWGIILAKAEVGTLAHSVHQGGPLVVVLIAILLMLMAFVVERFLSLRVAKGKSSVQVFFKNLIGHLQNNDFESALAACDVIYILKNGRITAGGTHGRLLKTSTYYRHAFDVQQFEDV